MARLYLKLDNVVLQQCAIEETPVTIGRLPDNLIHVDNLSVSGHHARVVKEDGRFVLYDENSTNGTYVNGQKVSEAVLVGGDTIHVGRHTLLFVDDGVTAAAPATPPVAEPPVFAAPDVLVGVITVLDGKTDRQEYVLTGEQTIIGKNENATIHLQRWFAPKVATIIYRRGEKYFIEGSDTQVPVRVNSEIVDGERELAAGDTILVDEVSLIFHFASQTR